MKVPWFIRADEDDRDSAEPLRNGERVIRRDSYSDNPRSCPSFHNDLSGKGGQIFDQNGQPVRRSLPRRK